MIGLLFFFFNDTATTEIYTLSLHDALPIWQERHHFPGGNQAALHHQDRNCPEVSRIAFLCAEARAFLSGRVGGNRANPPPLKRQATFLRLTTQRTAARRAFHARVAVASHLRTSADM